MKELIFTGACTALVTPFLNDQINYPMMEQLLRRQIDAGIEAVVICGTTGEAPTLSDVEKLELFSRAKSYVGDACRIIAGTGTNSRAYRATACTEANARAGARASARSAAASYSAAASANAKADACATAIYCAKTSKTKIRSIFAINYCYYSCRTTRSWWWYLGCHLDY